LGGVQHTKGTTNIVETKGCAIHPLNKAIDLLQRSIRFAQAWEETHGNESDGMAT
jgi:hypothetical protein